MQEINPEELKRSWIQLISFLESQFGEKPDLQAVIFLIGVQELGRGQRNFSKQEKMELMHLATCRLLSRYGYYRLKGIDDEGWPHYERVKPLPLLSLKEQDLMLKKATIEYFAENNIFIPE